MRIVNRTRWHAWDAVLSLLVVTCLCASAVAQVPRIHTFFPIGGRAGATVDVEIRGSDLTGADRLLVHGAGVSGTVDPGGAKVDESAKPIWQAKCQSCHELRSPANRSLSAAQWAATVERMVKVRQAPLSTDEAQKVTAYLVSAARAGRVTAQVKIASDAQPGLYEMRVGTPHGVSTVGMFEVGSIPEVMGAANNIAQPQPVTLPCAANGTLAASGERDCFKFSAQQGARYVFNLKAFRYTELTQMFFNPDLRLYNPSGAEIVENHGYYELDPLIDWTCPQTGDYVLEVRDLVGRGNPDSVYRLTMGVLPYDTVVFPPVVQAGGEQQILPAGKNLTGAVSPFRLKADSVVGLASVATPWGAHEVLVCGGPVILPGTGQMVHQLPAGFAGRFDTAGQTHSYTVEGSGRWEFVPYTDQLGSTASVRLSLHDAQNRGVGGGIGNGGIAADLEAGKPYRLDVVEANGHFGADIVYAIEARHSNPALICVLRPCNLFVRPGSSTVVETILTRREGIQGDVVVRAHDLPAGVTASEARIQPDRDRTWLVLRAAPDAPQGECPISVEAEANGPSGAVQARCLPEEEYRLNNDPRYTVRAECVLAVRGRADFSAELQPAGSLMVDTKKGIEVKLKITRQPNFKDDLVARIEGLPSGWTADQVGISGDRSEVTLIVRPDGNDRRPFLKRDPAMTPIMALVELIHRDNPYVMGSLSIKKPAVIDKDELN